MGSNEEKIGILFQAKTTGADLITISEEESIHGDYFRTGSHAAMIIAYDRTRSEFVTLEGNFNNSVQMYKRRVTELSWIVHTKTDMLR